VTADILPINFELN